MKKFFKKKTCNFAHVGGGVQGGGGVAAVAATAGRGRVKEGERREIGWGGGGALKCPLKQ